MHLLRVGEEARSLEKAFGIAVLRHKDKKPAGGKEDVEAHFGCEAHELVMVGDRCVCLYICLCVRHTLGVHVEAHFGCEAHELVMVGDRCVCIYVCVCAVCM